jgi:hypothetical protein
VEGARGTRVSWSEASECKSGKQGQSGLREEPRLGSRPSAVTSVLDTFRYNVMSEGVHCEWVHLYDVDPPPSMVAALAAESVRSGLGQVEAGVQFCTGVHDFDQDFA